MAIERLGALTDAHLSEKHALRGQRNLRSCQPMDDAVWARATDEFSRTFEPVVTAQASPPESQTALAQGELDGDEYAYDDSMREYGLRSNVQRRPWSPKRAREQFVAMVRSLLQGAMASG